MSLEQDITKLQEDGVFKAASAREVKKRQAESGIGYIVWVLVQSYDEREGDSVDVWEEEISKFDTEEEAIKFAGALARKA